MLSALILIVAAGIIVFGLSGITVRTGFAEVLTLTLGRMVIAAAVGTWAIFWNSKLKRFSLLGFSAICLGQSIYCAYVWHGEANKAKRDNAVLSRLQTNSAEVIQNAENGKPLDIKPTGDAQLDAEFQVFNELSSQYINDQKKVAVKLHPREENEIFSVKVLGSKSAVWDEGSKRLINLTAVELSETKFPALIESAKAKLSALGLSAAHRDTAMHAVEGFAAIHNQMISTLRDREYAEVKLLQFLQDNFGDYHLEQGQPIFTTASYGKAYQELVDAVARARKDENAFEQQQKARIEAIKAKMRELGA